ncbi:hypothetical protein [Demequina maris]|uniref:hypothetical protein n=1 Tax=Demequina maris TaxID=1638982 RepID=UPI000784FC56|nr:hypothetical protein [Demequina maris]
MRWWLLAGAVTVLALAVIAVVLPVRSEAVAAPVQAVAVPVGTEDGVCGTVTLTAALSAEVATPLVDLLGRSHVTGIEASEVALDLEVDPACGDGLETAGGTASLWPVDCRAWDLAEATPLPTVRCYDTELRFPLAPAEGEPAGVAWEGAAFPLGDARVRDTRWCTEVYATLGALVGDAGLSATELEPGELCLDLDNA